MSNLFTSLTAPATTIKHPDNQRPPHHLQHLQVETPPKTPIPSILNNPENLEEKTTGDLKNPNQNFSSCRSPLNQGLDAIAIYCAEFGAFKIPIENGSIRIELISPTVEIASQS